MRVTEAKQTLTTFVEWCMSGVEQETEAAWDYNKKMYTKRADSSRLKWNV